MIFNVVIEYDRHKTVEHYKDERHLQRHMGYEGNWCQSDQHKLIIEHQFLPQMIICSPF